MTNAAAAYPTTPSGQPPVSAQTNVATYRISTVDYAVTKTLVSPANRPAVVGEPVIFSIVVTNTGDIPLTTVSVTDTYEVAYLAFANATPPASDSVNDGVLTWANIGPVAARAAASISVTFTSVAETLGRTNRVVARPTAPPGEPTAYPKTNSTVYSAQYAWIGDTVWVDVNSDGIPNENLTTWGIDGVTLRLYRMVGGVPVFVAQTVTRTDAGRRGYFLFSGLTFGDYQVDVDVATIPARLDVVTTRTTIPVSLTPDGFNVNADFGFTFPPTAVTLKSFVAAGGAGGVAVRWETGVEIRNLGFNLYRSDSANGPRTRLNGNLIPGLGTSSGQVYEWLDAGATAGTTYYYWLEDVQDDFQTEVHGPAIRWGTADSNRDPYTVGGFSTSGVGGLYRISYETLTNAGITAESIDPATLAVRIDGHVVPACVVAEGQVLQPGDFLLFYAPPSPDSLACEIAVMPDAPRMPLVLARPSRAAGNVWVGAAEPGQGLYFDTTTNCVRYLVTDFTQAPVWLLDVTEETNSMLMYGYSYVSATNGHTAVYLSYSPTSGAVATCLAVQDDVVIEVRTVNPR